MGPAHGAHPDVRAFGDAVVVQIKLSSGKTPTRLSLGELADVDLTNVWPVHDIPAWRGRRTYEGSWWFSGLSRSIPFASLEEQDLLMVLDSGQDVVAVIPRPLSLVRRSDDAKLLVAPSFYVKFRDGREVLTHHGAVSPELVRIVEQDSGFVLARWMPDAISLMNLSWLSGFRFSRCRPSETVESGIRRIFRQPTALRAGTARSARLCDISLDAALVGVYSMLWRGELLVPLSALPLSDRSIVRSA